MNAIAAEKWSLARDTAPWTTYSIAPVSKPRMTQSDKWKTRAPVMKYRAFKDACRDHSVGIGSAFSVEFFIPMPKSWSLKKKDLLAYTPHQSRPDLDNLIKALCDAVMVEDSVIWRINASKFWSDIGQIRIRIESEL